MIIPLKSWSTGLELLGEMHLNVQTVSIGNLFSYQTCVMSKQMNRCSMLWFNIYPWPKLTQLLLHMLPYSVLKQFPRRMDHKFGIGNLLDTLGSRMTKLARSQGIPWKLNSLKCLKRIFPKKPKSFFSNKVTFKYYPQ